MAPKPGKLQGWLWVLLVAVCGRGVWCQDLGDTGIWFVEEPQDVIAEKNKPLVWNCSGGSQPTLGAVRYSWKHEGQPLTFDLRRQVQQNGSLYFARVIQRRKRSRTDEGSYTCLVSNDHGTIASRTAMLTIASLSRFTESPQSVSVLEGSAARLQCKISGLPQPVISWQKNRQNLPQNSRYTTLNSGVLQISNVAAEDAGRYRCVAENVANTRRSSEAVLTVQPASAGSSQEVSLQSSPQQLTHMVGEQVVLECAAAGLPAPKVQWTRPGGQPLTGERYEKIGGSNLRISNLIAADTGDYICKAENADGSQTQEIKSSLVVLEPPLMVSLTRNVRKDQHFGVTLRCIASGFPTPTITWRKNGLPIEPSGRIKVQNEGSQAQLMISQSIKEDSGYYQCIASNAAGSTSQVMKVTIMKHDGAPERPYNLTARSLSSTEIQVSWSHSGKDIIGFSVHYKRPDAPERQNVVNSSPAIIKGLKPFSNYTIYMVAYTKQGGSDRSERITHKTMQGVPMTPPESTAIPWNTSALKVTWHELPPEQANGEVTHYKVFYRRHGAERWQVEEVAAPAVSHIISGLASGTKYDVRVLAATRVGYPTLLEEIWPWTTVQTPQQSYTTVPDPLDFQVVPYNSTAIIVKWKETNNSKAYGYKLTFSYHCNGGSTVDVAPTAMKYIISNLRPSSYYCITMTGFNDKGEGPAVQHEVSTLARGTGPTGGSAPPPPLDIDCEETETSSVVLRWSVDHDKVLSYSVCYYPTALQQQGVNCNSSSAQKVSSFTENVLIDGLQPFTYYSFAVCSVLGKRVGQFGQEIVCQTKDGLPSSPTNLKVALLSQGSVELNWQPPKKKNGVIVSYTILYRMDGKGGFWDKKMENGSATMSVLQDLKNDALYQFKMRAATRSGEGATSEVIRIRIERAASTTTKDPDQLRREQKLGIIVGVCIGGGCFIICALIIIFRNRCFPMRNAQQNVQPALNDLGAAHAQANGNGHIPGMPGTLHPVDPPDMDCTLPMLRCLPENEHSDSKGGDNSYKVGNGHVKNGMTHLPALEAVHLTSGEVQSRLCSASDYGHDGDSGTFPSQVAMDTFPLHANPRYSVEDDLDGIDYDQSSITAIADTQTDQSNFYLPQENTNSGLQSEPGSGTPENQDTDRKQRSAVRRGSPGRGEGYPDQRVSTSVMDSQGLSHTEKAGGRRHTASSIASPGTKDTSPLLHAAQSPNQSQGVPYMQPLRRSAPPSV